MLERLFKGFIGIGVAVLAIQVAAARDAPHQDCAGSVGHRLIDPYFRSADPTLSNPAGQAPLTYQLMVKVVVWLPDFYNEVLVGNMRVTDYLRGGPECHPRLKLPNSLVISMPSPRLPIPEGRR